MTSAPAANKATTVKDASAPKAAPKAAPRKKSSSGQGRNPYGYAEARIIELVIKPDIVAVINAGGVSGKGALLTKFRERFPKAAVSTSTMARWIELCGFKDLFEEKSITLPQAQAPVAASTVAATNVAA